MALSANALTTVANLRDELGITTGDYDTTLERLINAASERFASLCRREFAYSASAVERVKGGGTGHILVRRAPIVSIEAIKLSTGDSTTTYDATDYRIASANAGLIERINGCWPETADLVGVNFDPVASTQRDLIEVTYAGGFVTPQQDADDAELTRSLPYDIEEAVIVMAAQRYKSKGRDMAVTSRKALKASISYDHKAANMLPQLAREAVARYQWRH